MRKLTHLIVFLFALFQMEGVWAGQFESEIVVKRDDRGKIVKLDATDVSYGEMIQILAVLAERKVRIISTPDTPLTVHYIDRTPIDALKVLLSMPTLDVKTERGIYVVSRRKSSDIR